MPSKAEWTALASKPQWTHYDWLIELMTPLEETHPEVHHIAKTFLETPMKKASTPPQEGEERKVPSNKNDGIPYKIVPHNPTDPHLRRIVTGAQPGADGGLGSAASPQPTPAQPALRGFRYWTRRAAWMFAGAPTQAPEPIPQPRRPAAQPALRGGAYWTRRAAQMFAGAPTQAPEPNPQPRRPEAITVIEIDLFGVMVPVSDFFSALLVVLFFAIEADNIDDHVGRLIVATFWSYQYVKTRPAQDAIRAAMFNSGFALVVAADGSLVPRSFRAPGAALGPNNVLGAGGVSLPGATPRSAQNRDAKELARMLRLRQLLTTMNPKQARKIQSLAAGLQKYSDEKNKFCGECFGRNAPETKICNCAEAFVFLVLAYLLYHDLLDTSEIREIRLVSLDGQLLYSLVSEVLAQSGTAEEKWDAILTRVFPEASAELCHVCRVFVSAFHWAYPARLKNVVFTQWNRTTGNWQPMQIFNRGKLSRWILKRAMQRRMANLLRPFARRMVSGVTNVLGFCGITVAIAWPDDAAPRSRTRRLPARVVRSSTGPSNATTDGALTPAAAGTAGPSNTTTAAALTPPAVGTAGAVTSTAPTAISIANASPSSSMMGYLGNLGGGEGETADDSPPGSMIGFIVDFGREGEE